MRPTSPRFWRFNRERYTLTGAQCANCGERFLTPRLICPQCHSEIEQVARDVFPTLAGMKEENPVSVTVLIPSYNAAGTIRGTLSSLLAQDFDESYEIIVVDSSSDETPRIIASEFPTVHLIHLDQQTDPGTARNLGIVQAAGEIIACIDADCIAPPDWLKRMMAAQRADHEVVGGAVENGNSESVIAWAGYLGEFREWLPVGKPRLVNHVPTCNISYNRSIFARFGGFPTEFYPQEDLLFHWRLSQHGVPIWFDPNTRVRHVHRSTWRAYNRHLRRIGRITARVLKLTGDEGVFLARSPVLALLAAPVLPLVKWLRTVGVFMSQQPDVLREHTLALAPFLVGLCAWAMGFVEGAWSPPLRVSQGEPICQTG
ncbi:MAG TPA: glycosyltransferase [Thermoflexia bacterium]|nr:glycosyltransferase [Thermoflexia bacterium]